MGYLIGAILFLFAAFLGVGDIALHEYRSLGEAQEQCKTINQTQTDTIKGLQNSLSDITKQKGVADEAIQKANAQIAALGKQVAAHHEVKTDKLQQAINNVPDCKTWADAPICVDVSRVLSNTH